MTIPVSTQRRVWGLVLFLLIGALVFHWWNRFQSSAGTVTVRRQPLGVMGTDSQIVAVIPHDKIGQSDRILAAAENELRRLEALFSTWIESSELSQFNTAPVGVEMKLSGDVTRLIDWSQELYRRTSGAFDITARPILEQWQSGVERHRRPTFAELEAARLASSWADFRFRVLERTGIRLKDTATLDVDGIAKGYAVDLALESLMEAGAVGGMVEVGGDLRAAGAPPNGVSWPIGVQNPFAAGSLGSIDIESGAVCTSGSYARPVTIGDRSFSHIVDPRTGEPAAEDVSVTVIAPEASTADAWATALSVLGRPGLDLISGDTEVEALIIVGSPDNALAFVTRGFPEFSAGHGIRVQRLP